MDERSRKISSEVHVNPNYFRRKFIRHFIVGLYYQYPFCCVCRFSLGVLFKEKEQAFNRAGKKISGRKRITESGSFVVCGIFHKPDQDEVDYWNKQREFRARNGII